MLKDIELVLGVLCREAKVDERNALSLFDVYPVVAVQAKCSGKPAEDTLMVKLDSMVLLMVFRRKHNVNGAIHATAKAFLSADDQPPIVDGLVLDLSIPSEHDSTTQILNLEGAPIICPASEGVHEYQLNFAINDGETLFAQIQTPLRIHVSHSVS